MKKVLLVGILSTLILSACGTNSNYTSRRKLTGIDYSAYERAAVVPVAGVAAHDDFAAALPGPSVLDGQTAPGASQETEEPVLSEYEDFTSEEMAHIAGISQRHQGPVNEQAFHDCIRTILDQHGKASITTDADLLEQWKKMKESKGIRK